MKRILTLLVAIAACATLNPANAQAQDYLGGYQFGAGFRTYGCNGFVQTLPREQPPYFATHPPVYYSHIVKRPYGISPYAAPAGIAPVEMGFPAPETVKNIYFHEQIETAPQPAENKSDKKPKKTAKPKNEKTTWVPNVYVQAQRFASFNE